MEIRREVEKRFVASSKSYDPSKRVESVDSNELNKENKWDS